MALAPFIDGLSQLLCGERLIHTTIITLYSVTVNRVGVIPAPIYHAMDRCHPPSCVAIPSTNGIRRPIRTAKPTMSLKMDQLRSQTAKLPVV